MSDSRELLVLRREVLVARASLQRLRAARDLDTLREGLSWPGAVASIATSTAGRSVLLGLIVLVAGRGRAARIVRLAGAAILVAKLVAGLARKGPSTDSEGGATPT
jgi:hypothetical protein